MSQNIELQLTGETKELTILQGNALPPHEPRPISLKGNFDAPAEFVRKRIGDFSRSENPSKSPSIFPYVVPTPDSRYSPVVFDKVHAIFDFKNLSITLIIGEQERDTITVTGSLTKHPFLTLLGVSEKTHSHKDLLEIIKHEGRHFNSKSEYQWLKKALNDFKVKVDSDYKNATDKQTGSREVGLKQKAESELSGKLITLNVPFFDGYPPVLIDIEIGVEPDGHTVEIELINDDFKGLYEEAVKAEFEVQRPSFEPFVIIEK